MSGKNFYACLVFFILSTLTAFAQQSDQIAALRCDLADSEVDTQRIKILLALGQHYLYRPLELRVDLDSALWFAQEAATISTDRNSDKFKEQSFLLMSYCYFEGREIAKGRAAFGNVLEKYCAAGDKAGEALAWKEMGRLMHRNDSTMQEKILFFQRAMELYNEIGDRENQAHTLKEIADVHLNQGKLELCETELVEVLEQYQAIGFPYLHYTYDLLAIVNSMMGNLNRALYFGLLTIKSMEVTTDSSLAGNFYNRLAGIYEALGNAEKSVEWYKKSFAKNPNSNYGTCLHIAQGLIHLSKADEALAFATQVVQRYPPDNLRDRGIAANILGLCYNAVGKYDLAEKYYLEMTSYEERAAWYETENYPSNIYLAMGQFYVDRQRFSAAAPYLQRILAVPEGIVSINHLKDTHFLLFKVDSAAANYQQAIHHLQQFKLLNDSLFNETKSRQIEELQIQYETDKKEQNIKFLQNESQLQQIRLQKAGMAKNLTLAGIFLLLVVVALLYGRYRMKQRTNEQLRLHQIEISKTNESLQKLLEEKEWLLREIHHRVKNNLQIVMSLLNTQAMYLENEAALEAIRHSQYRIQSISLIHQKLYQSKNLTLIDMAGYIQELVKFLTDSFNIENRIRFELNIEDVELDVTQALPIGLILNEAISNAIKHAFPADRPGLIRISMRQKGAHHCLLTIADNGVGLDPDFDLRQRNSLGLNLMEGLSRQLGGRFHIRQQGGLLIRVRFANQPAGREMEENTELQLTT